jgi:hypothetical protein
MVLFWLFFVLVLVLVLSEAVRCGARARSITQLYHSILVNAMLGQEFGNG